jgi:hypothetical protein
LAQQAAEQAASGYPEAAEALLDQGFANEAQKYESDLWLLKCNLQAREPEAKLACLNACLALHALPLLAARHGHLPPAATNLRAASPIEHTKSGPIVTVLMTTYNSEARVQAAIASVLAQSWTSIQLIVVDDASIDGTVDIVEAIARVDERVRLIRLSSNTGTYAAKCIGLQHAVGDFVTCHDSDDWSHPLKIERQVVPLLESSSLVATTSCMVRVTDEGEFVARNVYPLMRLNPSSTMFRRDRVLVEVGSWDVVRTGADSEFLERLRVSFGEKSVHRVRQPLSLGSHRADSLMNGAATGYDVDGKSPARAVYMQAWKQWHLESRHSAIRLFIPTDPLRAVNERSFPAPSSIEVDAELLAKNVKEAGSSDFGKHLLQACRWAVRSQQIASIPTLGLLMGGEVFRLRWWQRPERVAGLLVWGRKPSAIRALRLTRSLKTPVQYLEDGFLRSFYPGQQHPPLSLVVDDTGIYYDSTRPSAIERLLESPEDLLANGVANDVVRARALVAEHGLSKYNHAPPLAQVQAVLGRPLLRTSDTERVLVVDQTAGDMSIALGGASAQTFADMLAAALAAFPRATVYVKTHPETASGRKGGHYATLADGERVVVLRETIEPLSLLRQMDCVYVVSSTLGFEALLAGKTVHCFGLPWYAGWGATVDMLRCERRTRTRTVDELFAAGYLRYARYVNPETHERGSIFDVIEWLARQRRMAGLLGGPHG